VEKTLLIVLAVLGAILLFGLLGPGPEAPVADVAGEQRLLDSGHFVIEQGGVPVVREAYTLLYSDRDGYLLLSQAELTVQSASVTLAQQLQLDRALQPFVYQLGANTPSGSQLISAQRGPVGTHMEVRAGTAQQGADVPVVGKDAILDNSLASHYVVLWMAVAAGAIEHDFTALVPQRLLALPARVEDPRAAEFTSAGVRYAGQLLKLALGDLEVNLLVYGGRLVGLFIPAQVARAYNADLFPSGVVLLPSPKASGDLPRGVIERGLLFQNGDVTLVGTLTLPEQTASAVPAVLFLHGSGPVDRDENATGLKVDAFRQLAHALALQGVASLRYDKRGVGESGGTFATASRGDLLSDARAALEALRAASGIDSRRSFVLGHSEGGYLAPLLAAEDKTIAGVVLLAAPARSLDQITRWQVEALQRLGGSNESLIAQVLAQQDQFIAFVKASKGEWADSSLETLKSAMPWITEDQAGAMRAVSLVWLREHYLEDPLAALRRVTCPVLVVQGEKDLQVPASEAELLEKTLREAGNTDVTVEILPDLNHLLRHHPEEPNLAYQHLDEPLDPRVVAAVTTWVVAHRVP